MALCRQLFCRKTSHRLALQFWPYTICSSNIVFLSLSFFFRLFFGSREIKKKCYTNFHKLQPIYDFPEKQRQQYAEKRLLLGYYFNIRNSATDQINLIKGWDESPNNTQGNTRRGHRSFHFLKFIEII